MIKKKIMIGMSGGVDSAVAAYLLKKEGYDVAGATMKLFDDEKTSLAIKDAKDICDILNIKHYVFELQEEFKNIVINNFIESYKNALTPNPCVVCNRYFKFDLFYEKSKELGYDFIASGHYAKIEDGKLKKASNVEKDQSYFLYGIRKDILDKVIFPLSDFKSKDEIRNIALEANLKIDNKKDSQEVCFIPNDDYKAFLDDKLSVNCPEGDICLESDNTILGRHKGLFNYTIGQRKGLNVSYNTPLYVTRLDHKNNVVYVGSNSDLFHDEILAGSINLLTDSLPKEVFAKVRSRGKEEKAIVTKLSDGKLKIKFETKQRAITKGQSVVFYDDEKTCLGGGIIEEIY